MNKASGGDGIPVELFQILKDAAVKVLHSIYQQIWRIQQWPQDWKRCFHSNLKERQCQRMYRCESWTVKKAEHRRTDALKLWCWRVPWTGRRSNQSILKDINPEYSLEGLMLKRQYFGHLMQKANSLEKILMLGKPEGRRRRG